MNISYGVVVTVEALDKPEGFVSIAVGPRYGYHTTVRGVFADADVEAQREFVRTSTANVLELERMNAEADAAEAEADAAER